MASWLGKGQSFQELLALRPDLQSKYSAFLDAISTSDTVPDRVLELCRRRIEQIHGLADAAEPHGDLTAAEQAALAVAERIPYQHHELNDEEVAAVKAAFGEAGCVALLTALAFFDVTSRLESTFRLRSV